MIRRRVWRDAPLPEGRITLGGPGLPGDLPRPMPRAEVIPDHSALQSELRAAKARQAKLEAELEEAQRQLREATSLLTEMQECLHSERAHAKEQGYAEGLEQAQVTAQRELAQQLAHWQRSADEMLRAADAHWQALRAELADVVMASLVKLLGEQMANPHAVRAAVEQALKDSSVGTAPRVLLAPAQYEQLLKSGGAQLSWFKERRLDIAPDPRVTHGGCLLETQSGLIDARFDTQLARLREIVTGHYSGNAR